MKNKSYLTEESIKIISYEIFLEIAKVARPLIEKKLWWMDGFYHQLLIDEIERRFITKCIEYIKEHNE